MTHYLLSVHTSADAAPSRMTDDEAREGFARIAGLEDEMRSAGALVVSGRLAEADAAAVVDASSGKAITTDGPFIESKEVLGGFYIIDASDRAAALAWAEKTSASIGMPIEVRPFHGLRTEPVDGR